MYTLPKSQKFLIESRLCSLHFNENKILKLLIALNIHKAHGLDEISIKIIKTCDELLLKSSFL